jgi:hypothetical protein
MNREYAAGKPSWSICSIVSVETNHETWRKGLHQLQFNNLPQLRRQINACSPQITQPIWITRRYERIRVVQYIKTSSNVNRLLERIRYAFDSHLLLVILYIVPLLPDLLSSPNHLQNSLITWSDLILVATQNCIRAAPSSKALAESRHDEWNACFICTLSFPVKHKLARFFWLSTPQWNAFNFLQRVSN